MKKLIILAVLLTSTLAFADADRTAYLKEHIKALQLESQILASNTAIRQKQLQDDFDKTMKELQPILDAEKKAAEAKKPAEKK